MTNTTSLKMTSIALFTLSMLACGQDLTSDEIGSPSGGAGGTGPANTGGIGTGGTTIEVAGVGGAPASTGGAPGTGTQAAPHSEFSFSVSPVRALDLVFMIDNSPSMTPKQEKLKAQFPKLIAALKDPITNLLPDLHVAIINSDLGTGGAYPKDSTCGPNAANDFSSYGNKGRFQMPRAEACGVTDPNAKFLVFEKGAGVNFKGDIVDVFQCLASGIGITGCGQEHQLQAFEWALMDLGAEIGNQDQIKAFLRPEAHLGLVFLTDEDDCSAALNNGLFGSNPGRSDLSRESASLRCATRAHQCGGNNLTSAGPGYPTTAAFSADVSTCTPRIDSCPNPTNLTSPSTATPTDTSNPALGCSPLKDVKLLADEIKSLKPNNPSKILVAGIFGWPLAGQAALPYKIDLIPNPAYVPGTTVKDRIYDLWPVCYDPNFLPADANAYDFRAAGNGATPGLRDAAFIDQFGANGLKFSICAPDFADAMTGLGTSLATKIQNLCLDAKLVDTDLNTPGVQPDCRVSYRIPVLDNVGEGMKLADGAVSLTLCPAGATPDTIQNDCWQLLSDNNTCPINGQQVNLLRTRAHRDDSPLNPGTVLSVRCQVCSDATAAASAGCAYTL